VPTDSTVFLLLVAGASFVAGAIAAVSGFGIGSLLIPLLAWRVGTQLAIAAVGIPHMTATALRFWILRKHVDRGLLLSFGSMSAAGGLLGALLHTRAQSALLTAIFSALLIWTGLTGLANVAGRFRFRGWVGWVAGAVSGALGGLVGNQGGIRSAAMLGFDVPRQAFVATSTAVGLIVDAVRVPVYLFNEGHAIWDLWPLLLTAVAASAVGTLVGGRLLGGLPEPVFRRLVHGLVLALGLYMLTQIGGDHRLQSPPVSGREAP
jgi:uncharacterized membrane protein YfcA